MDNHEAEQAAGAQKALFQEMKQLFDHYKVADHAERKYDHDVVIKELTEIIDKVDTAFSTVEIVDGVAVFPSGQIRARARRLSEDYLDYLVLHKDFVHDHPVVKIAVAKKILDYAQVENFHFDWHYWQLFRRHLVYDEAVADRNQILREIEKAPPHWAKKTDDTDDDSDDSWDSSSSGDE